GRIRTFLRMHSLEGALPACLHPGWQRCFSHGFAGSNVRLYPAGNRIPSCCLPDLERTPFPAESPAYRQIEIARIICNFCQMYRTVVEQIPVNRPQELGLWMRMIMQCSKPGHRIFLFQQCLDFTVYFILRRLVSIRSRIQYKDILTLFLIHPLTTLLPEYTTIDQLL